MGNKGRRGRRSSAGRGQFEKEAAETAPAEEDEAEAEEEQGWQPDDAKEAAAAVAGPYKTMETIRIIIGFWLRDTRFFGVCSGPIEVNMWSEPRDSSRETNLNGDKLPGVPHCYQTQLGHFISACYEAFGAGSLCGLTNRGALLLTLSVPYRRHAQRGKTAGRAGSEPQRPPPRKSGG